MLEEIIRAIDTPGVYIMMIVFGLVFVPYYIKIVHRQVTNPQEYHMMSFEKSLIIGFIIIAGLVLIGLLLLSMLVTSLTYAMIIPYGKDAPWNPSWPVALEPFRQQTNVWGVGHGIQETVFDVTFSDRAQFEKAWPAILKLKSPGAPLILDKAPSYHDVSGATMGPGVRVLWPSGTSADTRLCIWAMRN